jgi:hypothetical protein
MLNDVTEGSLMSKPVIDDAGDIFMLIASSTQQEQADAIQNGSVSPTASEAILAWSTDGCKTWQNSLIYSGLASNGDNAVQFGDIFNVIGMDGAGNLYAVGAGYIGNTRFEHVANVYFFKSTDGGQTWSAPMELDSPASAHMLPSIVGGEHPGEVAIGYFRTVNGKTDPNDAYGEWTYTVAESSDANSATPHWTYSDVNPGHIYHYQDICNSGLLCGSGLPGTGNNRDLADFTSAALDSGDCPAFVFADESVGNPAPVAHHLGGTPPPSLPPVGPPPSPPQVSPPSVLPSSPASSSPSPSPIPTPNVQVLPTVAHQVGPPCFPPRAAVVASPSAVASPTPAHASPSATVAGAGTHAPLPHLPNTEAARTLMLFGFAAIFLMAFTARVLTTPRRVRQ